MKALDRFEVWLVTGSQHLYGEAVLRQVAEQSRQVAAGLDGARAIPVSVVHKPPVTTPESIRDLLLEANASAECVGVVAWMHTFSPAKMWIAGLHGLQKPLLHLHTQFNRELPWAEIDMDFMNLNQSAHGDREFGYLATRMRLGRKTVVGHWTDPTVLERIGTWSRAACGWHEAQSLRVARFGDNMRQVAGTDGDKVEAQVRLGVSVNGYGVGELASAVGDVDDASVDRLLAEYEDAYELAPTLRAGGEQRESLRDAARIEAGLRGVLEAGGFKAFTATFEDLGGLRQLPGHRGPAADGRRLRVRSGGRLEDGGSGPPHEGDGRGARGRHLVHGGLHLPLRCRWSEGARRPHARGVSVDQRPQAELRDPSALDRGARGSGAARLHRSARAGRRHRPARPRQPLSARRKRGRRRRAGGGSAATAGRAGDLATKAELHDAAEGWLEAGGPHHTSFTQALTMDAFSDLAEIAGVEIVVIDEHTTVSDLKKELRWNSASYHLAQGS